MIKSIPAKMYLDLESDDKLYADLRAAHVAGTPVLVQINGHTAPAHVADCGIDTGLHGIKAEVSLRFADKFKPKTPKSRKKTRKPR